MKRIIKQKPSESQIEKWREKHPNVQHRDQTELWKSYKAERYKYVNAYKAEQGCQRCGIKDPRLLAFHHLDPSEKDGAISRLIGTRRSLKVIKAEMLKCQVVCHNCHTLIHWELRNPEDSP